MPKFARKDLRKPEKAGIRSSAAKINHKAPKMPAILLLNSHKYRSWFRRLFALRWLLSR
jgi:hypothetical protein